jgi:hypothetical protein
MGIDGFNTIVEKYGKKYSVVPDVLIIDGSNLIFICIESVLADLRKRFPAPWVGGINLNLKKQFRLLFDGVVSSIIRRINTAIHCSVSANDSNSYWNSSQSNENQNSLLNQNQIFLVFDPKETPKYVLTPNPEFSEEQLRLLFTEGEIMNNQSKILHIKLNEQIKRKRYRANNLKDINEYLQRIEIEDWRKSMINVINQVMYFNENKNKRLMWEFVMVELQRHYTIINAHDEADLVIKNLASEFAPSETILVLSADTDYYVLFYDSPNVFIRNISAKNIQGTYSPYQIIRSFLCGDFNENSQNVEIPASLIYRMAPIFGNDYTAHGKIIDCKTHHEHFKLLIQGELQKIHHMSSQLTLRKVCDKVRWDNDLNVNQNLDTMINLYDEDYFKYYMLSVLVYTDWIKMGKYEVFEGDLDIVTELQNIPACHWNYNNLTNEIFTDTEPIFMPSSNVPKTKLELFIEEVKERTEQNMDVDYSEDEIVEEDGAAFI